MIFLSSYGFLAMGFAQIMFQGAVSLSINRRTCTSSFNLVRFTQPKNYVVELSDGDNERVP